MNFRLSICRRFLNFCINPNSLKILLIGPGSIGLRHLRNLITLGYSKVSIVSRSGALPEEFSHLTVYSSLPTALAADAFDAAIVCTPTSFHTSAVKGLLEARVANIYIEKPVSNSFAQVEELLALEKTYPNNIIVGYDLHFDPGLQKVRELLQSNIIGKVVSVNARVGQYLPAWRPNEDYRKGMSARVETGGGVMLDLVHEFDYLLWLLGPINNVACRYCNSGALEIETEDVSEVLISFSSGALGTIHLDYLQQKLVRDCMVTGHNGTIFWDLAECSVKWVHESAVEQSYNYTGYERNNRFKDIMTAFLENNQDDRLTNLKDGVESLRLVLAAKHSSDNSVFVDIEKFNPVLN